MRADRQANKNKIYIARNIYVCVCERKRTQDLEGVKWPNFCSAKVPIRRARRHKQVGNGVKLLILQDFLNQLNHPISTFHFINIVKPRPQPIPRPLSVTPNAYPVRLSPEIKGRTPTSRPTGVAREVLVYHWLCLTPGTSHLTARFLTRAAANSLTHPMIVGVNE